MASKIDVKGRIDHSQACSFEKALLLIPQEEKEIILRFNSFGGNSAATDKIAELIHNRKSSGTVIIGQAVRAESAALRLFLCCDKEYREVIPSSIGRIHLPTENQPVTKTEKSIQVNTTLVFIEENTGLSRSDIESLNDLVLGSNEMIEYGIATKKVAVFR